MAKTAGGAPEAFKSVVVKGGMGDGATDDYGYGDPGYSDPSYEGPKAPYGNPAFPADHGADHGIGHRGAGAPGDFGGAGYRSATSDIRVPAASPDAVTIEAGGVRQLEVWSARAERQHGGWGQCHARNLGRARRLVQFVVRRNSFNRSG